MLNFLKSKQFIAILFLLILSSVIYYRWLSFDLFVYADHRYFSLDKLKDDILGYVWISDHSVGHLNILIWQYLSKLPAAFLSYLGLPYNFSDKIFCFWLIVFLLPISSFCLLKMVTNSNAGSFLGSLLFSFNTYYLSINGQGHLSLTISSIFCNFALLFFLRSLGDVSFRNIFLYCLFLLLSSTYDLRFTLIILSIIFLYSLLFLIFKKKYRIVFIVTFFPLLLFFILSSFWLIPQLNISNISLDPVFKRDIIYRDYWNIFYPFLLMHPFWSGFSDWQKVQPIQLYLFFIPILSIIPLFFKKKNKIIYFYYIVLLIGLFLSKQNSTPFSWFYDWLYNSLPLFSVFREATKFYYFIILGYSVIFSFLFALIFLRLKHFCFKVMIFIVATGFLLFPAINVYLGNMNSLYLKNDRPLGYSKLEEYLLNELKEDRFRVLLVPADTRWIYSSNLLNKYNLNGQIDDYWSTIQYNKNPEHPNIDILEQDFSEQLLSYYNTKYIIIPLDSSEDPWKDFSVYFKKDRDFYVEVLDRIPYLHRVEEDFGGIIVYENYNYGRYINSSSYMFFANNSLMGKKNIFNEVRRSSFYSTFDDNKKIVNASYLYELFRGSKEDARHIIQGDRLTLNTNDLYFDSSKKNLIIRKNGEELFIYLNSLNNIYLNGLEFGDKDLIDSDLVLSLKNRRYYLKIIYNNSEELSFGKIISDSSKDGDIVEGVEEGAAIEIYQLVDNLLINPSFEEGAWAEKVGDCNNYDSNPSLSMELDLTQKTLGQYSLKLSAQKHNACTNQKFDVTPGNYIVGFDYQSPNSNRAGSYLKLNDVNETIIKNDLVIEDSDWHSYHEELEVPEGTTSAQLHIYAYESDKNKNNIVRYDNFIFSRLNLEKKIVIVKPTEKYKKIELDLLEGDNVFEYKDTDHNYDNKFLNGSFEEGSWQEKVGDCHNYDDNKIITMSLNTDKKTDGDQSLQLEATRHVACVSKGILVEGGRNYILKFDYQSDDSKLAGYYVAFDNPEKTKFSEKINISNTDWNTFEKNIRVPEGSKKMTIFIYAYPTDNVTNNVVRYDNFQLIQLPDFEDRFYLVSEPKERLIEPRETNFDLINPTKKLVHVKGATTPFFLAMSESYHPQWELQMNNEKIQGLLDSWWPFAQRQKVGDEYHYKLANFLNAWYVDVPELCKEGNKACKKNDDGSYDIEMVVEFWPQRWFYLGLLISGTTLVGCVGYLGYDFVKNRKRKKKSLVVRTGEKF